MKGSFHRIFGISDIISISSIIDIFSIIGIIIFVL